MRDSRQIQHYQKCVIRDISKLNRLKNSVKHQETVKNTRKQCETEWNSHRQRHLWFPAVVTNTLHSFTPPFTKFSTRIFTPVGKSLHEHRSHLFHLWSKCKHCSKIPVTSRGVKYLKKMGGKLFQPPSQNNPGHFLTFIDSYATYLFYNNLFKLIYRFVHTIYVRS